MTTDEFKRLTESEQIAYLMRGGCVMPDLGKPAIREQVMDSLDQEEGE